MDAKNYKARISSSCRRHGSHSVTFTSEDITSWLCCANQQDILTRNGNHPTADYWLGGELQTPDQVASIAAEHLVEHLVNDDGTVPF